MKICLVGFVLRDASLKLKAKDRCKVVIREYIITDYPSLLKRHAIRPLPASPA
jgi:hypothetical protein